MTLSNSITASATSRGGAATVILFKDPPHEPPCSTAATSDPDPYCALLSSAGYTTRYIPVLCTTDLPAALDPVLALDPPPEAFVVTSVRAARVFARSATARERMPATVWAVGQATAKPLLSIPGIAVLGTDAGNAQELADQILAHYADGGRPLPNRAMVVLRGDKSLDVVPTRLREAGFNVMEVQVYATSARLDLPVDNIRAVQEDDPLDNWWVFFSPSGVGVVRGALGTGKVPVERVKIAAIGQTTAKYLTSAEVGWRVDTVAARPTAEGLVEAIAGHARNGVAE